LYLQLIFLAFPFSGIRTSTEAFSGRLPSVEVRPEYDNFPQYRWGRMTAADLYMQGSGPQGK